MLQRGRAAENVTSEGAKGKGSKGSKGYEGVSEADSLRRQA